MLRYYSVFNVAQCDGVTAPAIEGTDRAHNPIETAEQIVAAMPRRPAIRHGLDRAFYSPAADSVGMPSPERFETPENYYLELTEVVAGEGIEPPTQGFSVLCSTD